MDGEGFGDRMSRSDWSGEEKLDVMLDEQVVNFMLEASLESVIGDLVEAKNVAIEERRLARVSDVMADMVDFSNGEVILQHRSVLLVIVYLLREGKGEGVRGLGNQATGQIGKRNQSCRVQLALSMIQWCH